MRFLDLQCMTAWYDFVDKPGRNSEMSEWSICLTCMHSFAKNPEQWFVGEIAFLVLESPFMRAYSVSRVRS